MAGSYTPSKLGVCRGPWGPLSILRAAPPASLDPGTVVAVRVALDPASYGTATANVTSTSTLAFSGSSATPTAARA